MTAEVPDIDVIYTTDAPAIPSARNGYAKKMAVIGAFDTVEENPVLFNTLTEAYTTFGDDVENYDGCKIIDKLFNQASSVLAVNITSETELKRNIHVVLPVQLMVLMYLLMLDWLDSLVTTVMELSINH